METPSLDVKSTVERLERLEKQLEYLQMRLGPEQTIAARRFELKDHNGNRTAVLENTDDGTAFGLVDKNGVVRAQLKVEENEARLMLFAPDGKARVGVGQLADGGSVGIADVEENDRAWLRVDERGASLFLMDDEGNGGLGLTATAKEVGLAILDRESKARATLGLEADGAYINILDASGNAVFAKP